MRQASLFVMQFSWWLEKQCWACWCCNKEHDWGKVKLLSPSIDLYGYIFVSLTSREATAGSLSSFRCFLWCRLFESMHIFSLLCASSIVIRPVWDSRVKPSTTILTAASWSLLSGWHLLDSKICLVFSKMSLIVTPTLHPSVAGLCGCFIFHQYDLWGLVASCCAVIVGDDELHQWEISILEHILPVHCPVAGSWSPARGRFEHPVSMCQDSLIWMVPPSQLTDAELQLSQYFPAHTRSVARLWN